MSNGWLIRCDVKGYAYLSNYRSRSTFRFVTFCHTTLVLDTYMGNAKVPSDNPTFRGRHREEPSHRFQLMHQDRGKEEG